MMCMPGCGAERRVPLGGGSACRPMAGIRWAEVGVSKKVGARCRDAARFAPLPTPPFPGESNLHRTLTHYDIPFIPRRDWGVEARSLSPEVKVCNFSLSCEVGVTNPNGGVGGVKPEHRKRSWGQEQCPILGQMLPVLTTHNKGDALEPKLYLVRKQTCCDKEKPKNGCS